ncbi:MAG: methyltransferase domain-containing protein [Pelagimonas sp.]|jgi:2-polyprenyl-3-methyl-5-hydroxy-6-metoxy-1,4-benzoquinol methylase|nr:methyltransferase domain-containing protein [Pelagimonas sp.]
MAEAKGFWDGISAKYAAQPIRNMESYEATLERVRHWMSRDMAVLELGCGTGSTALALAENAGRITGTDFSEGMIREARAKLPGLSNVTFEVAEAGAAIAPGYDMIMCFNLLHLVEDRRALMAQARAALPEGGLFVSKTPCLAGKPWFWPLIKGMQLVGKAPKPVHMLSARTLEQEVAAAGFEIVEVGGYPKSLPNQLIVARAT